jgi:hypothetical protein
VKEEIRWTTPEIQAKALSLPAVNGKCFRITAGGNSKVFTVTAGYKSNNNPKKRLPAVSNRRARITGTGITLLLQRLMFVRDREFHEAIDGITAG